MPTSRHDVVSAALEVLDDEGLPGLTLRAVATRLGVSAPTLYWHVRDKRHLLDLLAERVLADLPQARQLPHQGEAVWDWLAEKARAHRRLLLAHADSAQVVAGNRPTEESTPVIERMLGVLVEAGLEPGEAVRVLTALNSYVLGDVLETQAEQERPLEEAPSRPQMQAYPLLTAAQASLGGAEERFEEGLRLLVDGLRLRLERGGERPAHPDDALQHRMRQESQRASS